MNITNLIIVIICILLFPFFVYVCSKMQMIGWLAGIDFYEKLKGDEKWQKNQK